MCEFLFRQGVEKALQNDDRFPQAGIQVMVSGIQDIPIAVWPWDQVLFQSFDRRLKTLSQLLHHFSQRCYFVEKLGPVGKEKERE